MSKDWFGTHRGIVAAGVGATDVEYRICVAARGLDDAEMSFG
jgi:hypothetical protein